MEHSNRGNTALHEWTLRLVKRCLELPKARGKPDRQRSFTRGHGWATNQVSHRKGHESASPSKRDTDSSLVRRIWDMI